jgi:hypothetical protein
MIQIPDLSHFTSVLTLSNNEVHNTGISTSRKPLVVVEVDNKW